MNCNKLNCNQLALEIKQLAHNFGFTAVGITDFNLDNAKNHFTAWLESHLQGELHYLEKNYAKLLHPEILWPEAKSVICCAIAYAPATADHLAAFAQYRDYSLVLSENLNQLAKLIAQRVTPLQYRVFAGNAPILEKALAAKAGIGWYGKNSLLLNQSAGSYLFLGEIFTNLELPPDQPISERCSNCQQCRHACPTQAIIAPYKLDVRRCIAYLTIEYRGVIPNEFRQLIGTRVFGCDQCQIACPWNHAAKELPTLVTFHPEFVTKDLAAWLLWDEATFKSKTANSPINRLGYERWLRNVAVALGNADKTPNNLAALQTRLENCSDLVYEHVAWAIQQFG